MNRLMEEYNRVVKEHFDLADEATLKTVVYVNEADKSQVLSSLANRLYGKIMKNVADIDFGTIPNTKGDITKMQNYPDLVETLDIIKELLVYYRQSTSDVDIVINAIANIKNLQRVWEKAFAIDCGIVVILYNTMCLSVVSATSLLIASTIEYIKEPDENKYIMVVQKVSKNKTGEAMMLKNLEKFNKACSTGEIEKTCKELCEKNHAVKHEMALLEQDQFLHESPIPAMIGAIEGLPAIVLSISSLLLLIGCIIPILRELTAMFCYAKQSASDYFAMEADIVRLNAEHVQYSSAKSPEAKKKIRDKQLKIADKLKKMSDTLAVKMSKAATYAQAEVKNDREDKVKINDIMDSSPDSVSSLF